MKKIKINKKSFKYGSYAFAATAILIAIVVVANALLGLDSVRNRLRFDITKNKLYSLTDTSVKMVKDLKKDVQVIILEQEKNFNAPEIVEVLKQYNLKSGGKITTKYVDVEKDPLYIKRELDPEQVKGIEKGSIVIKSGSKIKVINQSDLVEYDYSTGYA
jgi:septum formation topological specificity factor MinE